MRDDNQVAKLKHTRKFPFNLPLRLEFSYEWKKKIMTDKNIWDDDQVTESKEISSLPDYVSLALQLSRFFINDKQLWQIYIVSLTETNMQAFSFIQTLNCHVSKWINKWNNHNKSLIKINT